jgi:P4 family phage/plasmid primase-like protien
MTSGAATAGLSKKIDIPVPAQFSWRHIYANSQAYKKYGNMDGTRYFVVHKITIENGNQLIIRYGPDNNSAFIVPLIGDWEEFEKPDIEKQFDNKYLALRNYPPIIEQELREAKKALIDYLYDYFHNKPIGVAIMKAIKTNARIRDERMQRLEAPRPDKIIMQTAEHIKAKYKIVTIWETGEMRYYDNGVYVPGGERIIQEEAQRMFQYDMRNHLVDEITNAIKRDSYKNLNEFDADPNLINMVNGLYSIKDKKLLPHRPEYLSMNQKPIVCDPKAKPKIFYKFVNGVLYPSQVRTMTECLGYTFYRANPHEIYVTQVGRGANGKNVMMAILTALHGEDNVSTVSLRDLKSDPYALADLEGKDVNIDDEMSAGVITDMTLIKKLTGTAKTRIRQKYVKAHDAKLHAKIWFSTNEVPDIIDSSVGRYRREIVFLYPYTFVPNPKEPMEKLEDPDLEEKLTSPRELSGIFNVLMDALHRVLFEQNKRVHVDMQTINERRKHRELMRNPMQFFVEAVVDLDNSLPNDIIAKEDLYNIHKHWFKLNKVLPLDNHEFGKQLRKIIGEDRLKDNARESTPDPVTGKRRTAWKGIRVKPEWQGDYLKNGKQTSLLQQQSQEEEEESIIQNKNMGAVYVKMSDLSPLFSFLEG